MSARPLIFWFRQDLRLGDNLALQAACAAGLPVLPVYCHDPAQDAPSRWGFVRRGGHRRAFLSAALTDLDVALRARGSRLVTLNASPAEALPRLAQAIGAETVVCEQIAAPEEQAVVEVLSAAGLVVRTVWQSSLLDLDDLPFEPSRLPPVFTTFRQALEGAGVQPREPVPAPAVLPSLPTPLLAQLESLICSPDLSATAWDEPAAASMLPAQAAQAGFPYWEARCSGGEQAAAAYLQRYFSTDLPRHYKTTRNGLSGTDYSSKWSPWLAQGALSPRTIFAALRRYEAERGANDGTYWLWVELLWRDYFRLLHLQHGARLYRGAGLAAQAPAPRHDPLVFARWCRGETGQPLVDAGMRELAATGYLSNRLRQIVASYLIHDLGGDWRAGAAWFESQLVDYDVYSNQGNWLYLAGRGTDPRGGRRFNPDKQARDYDPDGAYRRLWSTA